MSSALSRLLVRSLLRSSYRLEKQLIRGSSALRIQLESNVFKKLFPAYNLLEGTTVLNPQLRKLVKAEVRKLQTLPQEEMAVKEKEAFQILQKMNERLAVLSQMEYEPHSEATTNDIKITVDCVYFQDRFQYNIKIENLHPTNTRQLLGRSWHIMNGLGHVEDVSGAGVVGETPILEPGKSFSYSSWTKTNMWYHGVMSGEYEFLDITTNEKFQAKINPFGLVMLKPPSQTPRAPKQESEPNETTSPPN